MNIPVPQLPLALGARRDQRFDTFIGAAGAVLQDAVQGRERGAWLVTGAAGSGKTHLLLAACAERPGDAMYVALPQVAGSLRALFPMCDGKTLLALDGLDAIAGHAEDELAAFDLHNAALDRGATLLYAARQTPDDLGLRLPDLRSRLAQATRLPLPVLDDAGRLRALQARAQRSGLELDTATGEWLLRRFDRDLGSLMAQMDRLDQASLAAQRRLTIPFLRQVLGDGRD